jgi:hypothetical protein
MAEVKATKCDGCGRLTEKPDEWIFFNPPTTIVRQAIGTPAVKVAREVATICSPQCLNTLVSGTRPR